jgi:hypothetical protein
MKNFLNGTKIETSGKKTCSAQAYGCTQTRCVQGCHFEKESRTWS